MLITRTPLVFSTNPTGWLLLVAFVVSYTIWSGMELMIQVIILVADVAIAYAGQRISPTTVTICVYAGVSEIPSVMG